MYTIFYLQVYKGQTIFWCWIGNFLNKRFAEPLMNYLQAQEIEINCMHPPNKLVAAAKR